MNLWEVPEDFRPLVSQDSRLKYYSNNPFKLLLIKRFFNKIIKMIKLVEPKEILEVGSGEGIAGYLILRKWPGVEYYGSDLDPKSLSIAGKILSKNLVQLDARSLPFADKSFDLVLFLEVFEHISEWERAFAEGIRVAKKAIIFSVPAYPWYQVSNLIFFKNLGRMGEHPGHLHKFQWSSTQRKLDILSRSLNFNINLDFSFPWIIGKARMG